MLRVSGVLERRRRDLSGEEGQVLPVLLTAIIAILAITMLLLQVGRAGLLDTRTQTAADAAALAAMKAIENSLIGDFETGEGLGWPHPDAATLRAVADDYANRNGGEVIDFDFQPGYGTYAVSVETRSREKQGGDLEGVQNDHATADATATLTLSSCLTPHSTTDDGDDLTTLVCAGVGQIAQWAGDHPPQTAVDAIAARTDVQLVGEMPTLAPRLTTDGLNNEAAKGAPITREEIIDRALTWVGPPPVPYDMHAFTNRGTGRYRTDCSGFVSMAWRLDTPYGGLSTETLPGVAHQVSKEQLEPGDIMLWQNGPGIGHVIIFAGWTNSARTEYTAIEQTPDYTQMHSIPYNGISAGGVYTPYSYDRIKESDNKKQAA